MPRVAPILRVFVALLVLSCGNWMRVSAQAPQQASPAKFDEFSSVGHCDLTARLDNLAIQIQNTPRSTAYILVYAPEGEGGGTGKYFFELIKDYLVNIRGLRADRIEMIYGGRNSDLHHPKTELWIGSKGTPPPEPQKYETNVDTFKGLFADEKAWDNDFGIYIEDEMVQASAEQLVLHSQISFINRKTLLGISWLTTAKMRRRAHGEE